MARTIVQTQTPGWFEDPATGKKTRKQDGDTVVSRAEYDQMLLDAEDTPAAADATVNGQQVDHKTTESRNAEHRANAAAAAPVRLTSGKLSKGKTVEIRCAWVDPDKRSPAQAKLFAGPRSKLTHDAVAKAATGPENAPDGRLVVINAQDAFQVRFHPDNQRKWRAELRRAKTKARREAARKAVKA